MSGIAVSLLLCCTLIDGPPAKGPTVVVTQPDESKFPEITVYFEVKQPDGKFILDAKREEFRVTEDDHDRPILRFDSPVSSEVRATTVVLVVDHSGSMKQDDRIGGLKKAVATFLESLPAGSRVAVIAFSDDVEPICPFTTDPAKVRKAVDALEPDGATRYYEAVSSALKLLGKESGRRAVLALTDGEDNASWRELKLIPSARDVDELPKEGKNLTVVALVRRVLHFRVFDSEGEMVLDTDEKTLEDQGRKAEDLKGQLKDYIRSFSPGEKLTGSEKDQIMEVASMITGYKYVSPRSALERVIKEAQTLGLPVHTLGLGNEREIPVDRLARLATETRGQHYLARDADQLGKIYVEIAQRLGSSYSLTYQTEHKVPDGTLRPIRIYYKEATQAAETAVYIRGMIVREAGWSRLFLLLLIALGVLALAPSFLKKSSVPG